MQSCNFKFVLTGKFHQDTIERFFWQNTTSWLSEWPPNSTNVSTVARNIVIVQPVKVFNVQKLSGSWRGEANFGHP